MGTVGEKSGAFTKAVLLTLALCGGARLAYDEYLLRELTLHVRADTAFESEQARRCTQGAPGHTPVADTSISTSKTGVTP